MNVSFQSSLFLCLLILCGSAPAFAEEESAARVGWPQATQSALPWTRWWWHGSAVDADNITRCLEKYAAAGLSGVEITCIYGVRGAEDRYLPYLSPEWIEAVTHAVNEAKRLGMGVDLPPGSGWRMGGPFVPLADSNEVFILTHETAAPGSAWRHEFGERMPAAVVAYGEGGKIADLSGDVDNNGIVEWHVPQNAGEWTIYILTDRPIRERVKRPAPGGEGLNINPFSRTSVTHFLDNLAQRLAPLPAGSIRASFHDSFEYEGNWSSSFLKKFAECRGYRLQDHLPELDDVGDPDTVARVKCDYRETMSDLVHDELIVPWVEWAHAHGQLARNQAHGSPGNWLDLYAACDIPETESFGPLEKPDASPLVQQFASSAAHVAGRRLVSSESATWLGEHFTVTLAMVKKRLDRQMLAGVNHVFYHGTAYSPADAAWPGWVFYASTQLNPQNPIWRDFPALNQYVARCQSLLQAGSPANDILLYWPIFDVWHNPRGLRQDLRVHNSPEWFGDQPIGKVAAALSERGVSFDYVSDRQIADCRLVDENIRTPGASYRSILVPQAKYMPVKTLQKLRVLAEAGANVIFLGQLPESPPGLMNPDKEQAFDAVQAAVAERAVTVAGIDELFERDLVTPVPFYAKSPLRTIKRNFDDGVCYLLKNPSDQDFDGWITVGAAWDSLAFLDPLTGNIGRPDNNAQSEVRVQLPAGATIFLRTFDHEIALDKWHYREAEGARTEFQPEWRIEFISGGPALPDPVTAQKLKSWTELAGADGERFAGTAAYHAALSLPSEGPGKYLLELGKVADSARVLLNGKEVEVLISAPFETVLEVTDRENELVVEVTNVAANRIRDLDRRGVEWRIFHDINLVNINYRPFDASNWPIRPAGLLGPVTLQKLEGP